MPTAIFSVNPFTVSANNACPSSICPTCLTHHLDAATAIALANNYTASETAYLNLLYTYNQLMDGGSTNALLTQIQQSWSTDAVILRDELLAVSPYLSQEVLRETANNGILPHAMLLTVLMANPDATKDEDFIYFLQNQIPDPLPQYMIDLIVSSWDEGTARTSMENLLAGFSADMANTSNRILTDLYMKNGLDRDTLPTDTTNYQVQINYWLNRIQTLSAKYDLIENYLRDQEFAMAETILNSIPVNFNLSDRQLEEYTDYQFFYNFRKELIEGENDLSSLDASHLETLINFTTGDLNRAKELAKNALCFYYSICSEDNFDEPSGSRLMHSGNAPASVSAIQNKNDSAVVTVSPNPVTDIAVFNYLIPASKDQVVLSIWNVSGKQVASFVLADKQGQLKWFTGNINNGLYYYFVKDGKTRIASGKIFIKNNSCIKKGCILCGLF